MPADHARVEGGCERGDPVFSVPVHGPAHLVELGAVVSVSCRIDRGPVVGVAVGNVGDPPESVHVLLGGQDEHGWPDSTGDLRDLGMTEGPGAAPDGERFAAQPEENRVTGESAAEDTEVSSDLGHRQWPAVEVESLVDHGELEVLL